MSDRPFYIGEAIKSAWEFTKAHLGFLIVYQLILIIFSLLTHFTKDQWFWVIICTLITILLKMGFVNSALLITKGIKPQFDQLYKNWRLSIRWVVANFLFGFMFIIGLILFIIPGLYVWARYGFYSFALLDQNLGPIQALQKSAEITKGNRWHVFWLFIVCALLDLLGIMLFGIGILITGPLALITLAIVYRQLKMRVTSDFL